jgi:hypothetical protein
MGKSSKVIRIVKIMIYEPLNASQAWILRGEHVYMWKICVK